MSNLTRRVLRWGWQQHVCRIVNWVKDSDRGYEVAFSVWSRRHMSMRKVHLPIMQLMQVTVPQQMHKCSVSVIDFILHPLRWSWCVRRRIHWSSLWNAYSERFEVKVMLHSSSKLLIDWKKKNISVINILLLIVRFVNFFLSIFFFFSKVAIMHFYCSVIIWHS